MSNIVPTNQQPRQSFDLSPQTFDQALTFCDMLAASDLVPRDFKGKPGNCMIAIQWGSELGLKPLQALQNIAIINGRPALWGDAVIALVRSSPVCEYITESDDGEVATCRVKRRGGTEEVRTFSMVDAKLAGLFGKTGPWTQYPKRMRQMRARAFALRDVFADVLKGMPIAEEVMDYAPIGGPDTASVEVVEPAKPKEPPMYPQEKFDANLPAWTRLIEEGKKSASEIIATVETSGKLTDDQKSQIKAAENPVAVAEEVDEGQEEGDAE